MRKRALGFGFDVAGEGVELARPAGAVGRDGADAQRDRLGGARRVAAGARAREHASERDERRAADASHACP